MINIRHIINSINSNLVVSGQGNFDLLLVADTLFASGPDPPGKVRRMAPHQIEPKTRSLWRCQLSHSEFTIDILIGGLEHFLFFHILGIMIQTDFHIFQRGRSTTNQYLLMSVDWILSGIEKGYTPGSRAFHVSMALHWRH